MLCLNRPGSRLFHSLQPPSLPALRMDPLVGAVKNGKHCNGYAGVKLRGPHIVVVVAAACAPNYSFLFADQQAPSRSQLNYFASRSEERRVGKECRSRWS